jgi:hypothetical protein
VTGSRRLLTFRLDRDRRQRLATRLAGEGRTMSEVVIFGLQLYVQRSAWFSGPGVGEETGAAGTSEVTGVDEGSGAGEPTGAGVGGEDEETAGVGGGGELAAAGVAEIFVGETSAGETSAGETFVAETAAGGGGRATTAVVGVGDLALPDQVASYLRDLRKSGQSDLLSATLGRLHEVGWPLRPLATALGISRQAVQARVRQPLPDELRTQVPEVPPPAAVPRRRPAVSSGRRPHLTVKVDQGLRSDAHRQAVGEGRSLSQVIEKILDSYLHHGLPPREILLGDTTPTRPAPRRKHRGRPAKQASGEG